jgi:calcium-dependent protein kinase
LSDASAERVLFRQHCSKDAWCEQSINHDRDGGFSEESISLASESTMDTAGERRLNFDAESLSSVSECVSDVEVVPRRAMRSSVVACGMLPNLAVQKPGNIKNVYSFSKQEFDGGNGGVFRKATVRETGAVRAVKFIPKRLAPREMVAVRENIDILTRFDHPNLVSLHGIFEDSSHLYLVMDYCKGHTLERKLKDCVLSEVRAVIVMQQVLRAINFMHATDVCHRDLQPRNILFADSAKEIDINILVKIADSGSSCEMRRNQKRSEMIGAPSYMAPEMASGSYGRECDLWSCGVVLFEILCGRLPFSSTVQGASPIRQSKTVEAAFVQQDVIISKIARDLIGLLLETDPRSRLSATQALVHKCFKKAMPKMSSVPFDASTLAHLKPFRSLSPFQQAALQLVASHLSDAETANSRKLFHYLDKDGDVQLTPSELQKKIARDPQILAAYPQISELFRHVDRSDSSKDIAFTYTEFVAATFDREKCLTEAACRVAFRCFEKDGRGRVSIAEVAAGLTNGIRLWEMDEVADREIDLKEFMLMLKQEDTSVM